jgi:nucleoside-triphosphatase
VKIIIITGEKGKGKTTFLRKYLQKSGFDKSSTVGFYALNTGDDGYEIVNISTMERALLCKRHSPETGDIILQDFYFDQKVITLGEKWLAQGLTRNDPTFVIDEIGKFEIDGFVWNKVLKKIIENNTGTLIIVVRKKFLNQVVIYYGLDRKENVLEIIEV